eukprot:2417459-Pyramimonas_sp.AAC.1
MPSWVPESSFVTLCCTVSCRHAPGSDGKASPTTMGLTSAPSSPVRRGAPRTDLQGAAMTSGMEPDTHARAQPVNATRPEGTDAMFLSLGFRQELVPEALQSAVRATTVPT